MYSVALIPAHNEEASIGAAVEGIQQQRIKPKRLIVVTDNCTDDTEQRAIDAGAEVMATRGNRDKKAGALNQALGVILPSLDDDDVILIQDADTVLLYGFVVAALESLSQPNVGAVGGIFYGEPGKGLLGQVQRNEFARYAREIYRRKGRAHVLTGTATMIPVRVLREIRSESDGGVIPGPPGYYSTASLTEDDFLTKAVRTLGYTTMSPRGCEVETEVMGTVRELWHQRIRWQRGALQNIRAFGLTRVTAPYAARQALTGIMGAFFLLFLVLTTYSAIKIGFHTNALWLTIGGVFVTERVVTARSQGKRGVLLALLMIPETLFDLFMNIVYFSSLARLLTGRAERW